MKLSTLRMLSLVFSASLIVTLAISVQLPAQEQTDVGGSAHRPTIITFDAPGSVVTISSAINPAGAVTGLYVDANNVLHGFVRAKDGTITTFEAPGAGTGPGQGTQAISINPAGAITGRYFDASNVMHGFLRDRHGTFTTFDAPGAGTGPGQGTYADSINPAGAIAGNVDDDNNVAHGFLRAPDGTITTFDAPGAGTGPFQGTQTGNFCGLNPAGAIGGVVLDANSAFHGYVRAPDGTITTFDVTGAGTGKYQGTEAGDINPAGTTSGPYIDSGGVSHGFLRAADAAITTYDVPGAGTGSGQGTGTMGSCMNPAGTIVGNYLDASNVSHGYVRTSKGEITTFDVPGAGTGAGQGTIALSNNPADTITGFYLDANNVLHGFLRIP